MPIKIQNDLPAKHELEEENIFVMDESRALSQDFRELQIAILNLMPIKQICTRWANLHKNRNGFLL